MTDIAQLRLTDFRSYGALDVTLSPGAVIFFGPNGAGKTNLLEAISLLSPGRGLRRAGPDKLARTEGGVTAPAWGINAELTDATRISVGQIPEQPRRRQLRIDGKTATGGQLAKLLSVMWLTPAQDRLFTGPASDRRKFLDRFALAHRPGHGIATLRYEKARSERNRLLSDGINDIGWYEALETDMAIRGAEIAEARVITAKALQAEVDSRQSAFPKFKMAVDGFVEALILGGASRDEAEIHFREHLAETRPVDRRAGRTLTGPHKSDFELTHSGKAMPAGLCSTGEQKALLIGLVLSQARALKDRQPILLLDEIAAHLDAERRAALARELFDLNMQVFLTGTDQHLFSEYAGQAQIFEVIDGNLKSV